jgi:hypothetical protein
MDIGFLVTALSAGLAVGTTETTSNAIKDSYQALKKRLLERTRKEDVQSALTELERKPSSIDGDAEKELLSLANELLRKIETSGQWSKYNISIQNTQGVIIGDNAQVQQLFNSSEHKTNNESY